ncbi:MAG: hypothetical protein ACYDCO_04310 [Armatimonadota bacterium]
MVIGQAIDTAAALTAQSSVPVNAVDMLALRAALIEQGVDLGTQNHAQN